MMRMSEQAIVVAGNGAFQDKSTGRFTSGGKPVNMITPENSAAYHRLRQEKTQRAAAAAIARAANTGNSIAGLAYGIENIFRRAVSGEEDLDKSRKAIISSGQVAGLIPSFSSREVGSGGSATIIPTETMNRLLDIVASRVNVHGSE